MKDYFTEEIGEIRKFVVEDPTYSELSDEKLRERISNNAGKKNCISVN